MDFPFLRLASLNIYELVIESYSLHTFKFVVICVTLFILPVYSTMLCKCTCCIHFSVILVLSMGFGLWKMVDKCD